MGPINLDKIRQAHLKLMRLDPEYAQRFNANRKMAKIKVARSKELALPDADIFEDNNHLKFVRFYDDTLDRLGSSCPTVSIVAAGKPHIAQARPKPGQRYEVDGKYLTISQLAERFGIQVGTIRFRLSSGSTIEDAIKPVREERTYAHAGKTLTLKEWARETGIHAGTLKTRLQSGWSLEAALTVAVGATLGRTSRAGGWVKTSDNRAGTARPGSRDTEFKQGNLQ